MSFISKAKDLARLPFLWERLSKAAPGPDGALTEQSRKDADDFLRIIGAPSGAFNVIDEINWVYRRLNLVYKDISAQNCADLFIYYGPNFALELETDPNGFMKVVRGALMKHGSREIPPQFLEEVNQHVINKVKSTREKVVEWGKFINQRRTEAINVLHFLDHLYDGRPTKPDWMRHISNSLAQLQQNGVN